ncbi:MAG: hypothetical protein HPY76_13310 [Anaerolineae bacterium]|jgi:hypothetical protein|nr:hypothetical protein [Anaerolineae bacterium]
MVLSLPYVTADANALRAPISFSVAPREGYNQPIVDISSFLFGKINETLELIMPLQINIVRQSDLTYVVSDDVFLVYGHGDGLEEALIDYAESLASYYRIIENNSGVNPFDKKLFARLQTYIVPI